MRKRSDSKLDDMVRLRNLTNNQHSWRRYSLVSDLVVRNHQHFGQVARPKSNFSSGRRSVSFKSTEGYQEDKKSVKKFNNMMRRTKRQGSSGKDNIRGTRGSRKSDTSVQTNDQASRASDTPFRERLMVKNFPAI